MSIQISTEAGPIVGCSPLQRDGEEPAVLLLIFHRSKGKQVALNPTEAMQLGMSLMADAKRGMLLPPPDPED